MRRSRWLIAGTAVLATLLTLQPAAASDRDDDDRRAPARIDLPNGWQPEGITTDGKTLFIGSLRDGAIWAASPRTGKGEVLAEGAPGRVTVGVEYDERRDVIWAAGGPGGDVRAYDADDGDLLATYDFGTPRFVNDLVVTRDAVYATDSFSAELVVVPLRHDRKLPKPSVATTLPLGGDFTLQAGFNLNGIVESRGVLLTVQSNTGTLFRVDPGTGVATAVNLGGAKLTAGDGLELKGRTLYAVINAENRVAVLRLGSDLDDARVVKSLTDPALDVPTTAALARGSLWVVNARFGTPAGPGTEYYVTRLPRR